MARSARPLVGPATWAHSRFGMLFLAEVALMHSKELGHFVNKPFPTTLLSIGV